jgi:hypothetical protein
MMMLVHAERALHVNAVDQPPELVAHCMQGSGQAESEPLMHGD